MADEHLGGGATSVTFPALLSTFDRGTLASAVEVLVAVLDAMDPPSEDDPNFGTVADGLAGDAFDGEPDDGAKGDIAWVEWTTKPANLRRSGQHEIIPTWHEDDEEDDAPEEDDNDSAVDDRPCDDIDQDMEPECPVCPTYGVDQTHPLGHSPTEQNRRWGKL